MNAPPHGSGGMPQAPPVQSVHPGYPQGYPAGPPPKKNNSCLIVALVGGVALVIFVGIFAALGIYGFRRYLSAAKSAEAKNTVAAIGRAAAAAYEREALPDPDNPSAPEHRLCDSAIPVPGQVPRGNKYQSAPSDWTGGTYEGWKCLRFELNVPQYYQYHYNVNGSWVAPDNPAVPAGKGFEAAAQGDLDGDGNYSVFARVGRIDSSGMLTTSSQLYIQAEFE